MTYKNLKGFKVKDYKCFINKNGHQGFDDIKPVNVLIGKNNSGKSKILEFLKDWIQLNTKKQLLNMSSESKVGIVKRLEEVELKRYLKNTASDGTYDVFGRRLHWDNLGAYLIGTNFKCFSGAAEIDVPEHGMLKIIKGGMVNEKYKVLQHLARQLAGTIENPFWGYETLSIAAERDIKKEGLNTHSAPEDFSIAPDGTGITQLLVKCLNDSTGHSAGWQKLIEVTLLEKINSVLSPDLTFKRIFAKYETGQAWEIYLEEEKKGGIKLSDCGSGIKTIIMAMVMLYVLPDFRKNKKYVFLFEELENNLHPSLQRKLLSHIHDYIKTNPDHLLFLTTHSNIAIDLFSRDKDAQILRAYNDGEASFIEKIDTWAGHSSLLDDLGVKASDVLQANCLVWLEGPSDRIYFKKWLELFNDGAPLQEDLHYQCVFYGGSLLSHYSADTDVEREGEEDAAFIKMLRINRHGLVIMDSDKNGEGGQLKARVERILEETGSSDSAEGIINWVTAGREIENYLPQAVVDELCGTDCRLEQFGSFASLYKQQNKVQSFDKVDFARKATSSPAYTRENLESVYDLAEKMRNAIRYIRKCNNS